MKQYFITMHIKGDSADVRHDYCIAFFSESDALLTMKHLFQSGRYDWIGIREKSSPESGEQA